LISEFAKKLGETINAVENIQNQDDIDRGYPYAHVLAILVLTYFGK